MVTRPIFLTIPTGFTGAYPLTDGSPTPSTICAVVVDVFTMSGSMTPQYRCSTDAIQPPYTAPARNVAYSNLTTGASSPAATAITADGTYEITGDGGSIVMNVTVAPTAAVTLIVRLVLGAAQGGGTAAIQGGAAAGSASSGVNPLLVGGSNEAGNIATATTGQPGADGKAWTTKDGIITNAIDFLYNESSFDRQRGNTTIALLASAARTTTQTSADLTNFNGRALHVILDMTTVGTGSATVTINGKDPASGKYYLLLSGAAVITNVTNVYKVGLGFANTANVSVNDFVPRIFQIVVTANNANTATYSVGYNLLS